LISFARDPEGLAAKVDRDRRAEMTALDHGRKAQVAFNVLHVLSFGRYLHREEASPALEARLDISRRLDYHSKFLAQIAKSTVDIDVSWNLSDVRRSLEFISEHGTEAGSEAVLATAKVFARTKDAETRRACLNSLSRMSNPKARTQLLRISQNTSLDQAWRDLASEYLAKSNEPLPPIAVTASDVFHKSGQPR